LFVLFQPHRYSRTKAMAAEFGGCFEGAHKAFITDIYPAGEEPIAGVSADTVIRQVRQHGTTDVRYVPSLDAMIEETLNAVEPGDMVLILGAGDITTIGDALLDRLRGKERLDVGSPGNEKGRN
jgi:UDP-N-acetylmuramate--alanine ligase